MMTYRPGIFYAGRGGCDLTGFIVAAHIILSGEIARAVCMAVHGEVFRNQFKPWRQNINAEVRDADTDSMRFKSDS